MLLEWLTASLLGVWRPPAGLVEPSLGQSNLSFPTLVLQPSDPDRDRIFTTYLNQLAAQGYPPDTQAIWLQTDQQLLFDHGGDRSQTPASLTKVGTTLAALKTWGPHHRFQTQLMAGGVLDAKEWQDGVLKGDLVIEFTGDPLLLTPEWVALGRQLNQLGIRRVTGNLVIEGLSLANFQPEAIAVGNQIRQIWQGQGAGSPQPMITIEGAVVETLGIPNRVGTPLLTHESLPLFEILRYMNIYSSNTIADWLAQLMGGATVLETAAVNSQRVFPKEVVLNNGSGLGQDNRLSPRAVVGLFQGIQAELAPHGLTVHDLFPVAGRDRGTVEERKLPYATAVKTGTLWNTSALAGMVPTQRYGPVWFAIMNQGDANTLGFRQTQDQLLQTLVKAWGKGHRLPGPLGPTLPGAERERSRAIDQWLHAEFWGM